MGYNDRKMWICGHVRKMISKRQRKDARGDYTRSCSRYYTLPSVDGEDKFVCKMFFLHTLGYSADKVITVAMSSPPNGNNVTVSGDERGKHEPSNKFSKEFEVLLHQHIESYHPSISHYRREHAPLRRYLSPELTITEMHQDFINEYPTNMCGYETYRKAVEDKNVAFTKLGEEECELCIEHEKHNKQCNKQSNCEPCMLWNVHMESARISRSHYKQDVARKLEDHEAFLSVDMQKVIMLPRLPGVKTCLFTRRLVAFHETFAPLGGKMAKSCTIRPIVGIVWHEAISGRNAEDIMSAYVKAMQHPSYRDYTEFTFYTDNCTTQNRNWTIFTGMVALVNRIGGPDKVTFKYLEKGHTFMSADSFHAKVEEAMLSIGGVQLSR